MLTLAYLYEEVANRTYLPYLDTWAEWVMQICRAQRKTACSTSCSIRKTGSSCRDDTLMMSVLPLAKIGKLLNRPQYIAEAQRQFPIHIKYLFDRQSGLWFHGWTFDGRHNFANALWARGNCWVTIAIPEFIELLELAPGNPLRRFLLDTLQAQVSTLGRGPSSGLWHTLLMDESSILRLPHARFAYGILKSVRKRYFCPMR